MVGIVHISRYRTGQFVFMFNVQVINWEQYMCIPRSAGLSQESKDLILSLCTSHDRRLGRNGTDEIKNQVWSA